MAKGKKFGLTKESCIIQDSHGIRRTLYRIKALKTTADLVKGELGGWVESEDNLSQDGSCWIDTAGTVYGEACIFEDAHVSGIVSGHAKVYGTSSVGFRCSVSEYAMLLGHTVLTGFATVSGVAKLYDISVGDEAKIYGSIELSKATMPCYTIGGHARIAFPCDYAFIGPLGSNGRPLLVNADALHGIAYSTGCFHGNEAQFRAAIKRKHGDRILGKQYKAAIEFVKMTVKPYKKTKKEKQS